ncbi:MAG TPA: hypothetical protein VL360_00725 [Gammaproteobacteria bacterium]|jgi:hypothetical protein|nr:hypothetical protein [Gammaproteobacteria bacterium]
MLSVIWNWIKNLFLHCFPSLQPEPPMQETDPLLIPDDEHRDGEQVPPDGNNAHHELTSSQLIVRELNKPVSLTPEESALVIYHAQRGENDYIDNLSSQKQNKAYELITSFVKYNINQVEHSMKRLLELNKNANRLETSWRRVRSDFRDGNPSQYNIIPFCNDFKAKYIDSNTIRGRLQNALVDKIIESFNFCKQMLALKISRRHHTKQLKTYMPPNEDYMDIVMRTESKMNVKTLKILNDFDKRCADYEKENPPPEPRKRKGKLYGYNK